MFVSCGFVSLMITTGINVNLQDKNGRTPISQCTDEACLSALVNHPTCDVNIQTKVLMLLLLLLLLDDMLNT